METQGSLSELRRIEVTGMRIYLLDFPDSGPRESSISFLVLKAHNLPHSERWLRMKRRFFVIVSDEETKRKSASVKMDGQVAEWNEKLAPLWDIPF
jgi:hypothetical protein